MRGQQIHIVLRLELCRILTAALCGHQDFSLELDEAFPNCPGNLWAKVITVEGIAAYPGVACDAESRWLFSSRVSSWVERLSDLVSSLKRLLVLGHLFLPSMRMLLVWMRMDSDTVTCWILWVGSRFVVEKKHLQGTSKSQIKRGIFVGFSAGFAGTMLAPLRYTVWSNSISPTGAGSFKYLSGSVGRFWCETMMTILACHFLLLQCDYVLPLTLMIFLWTFGQPSLSVPKSTVNMSDVSNYFLPYKSFPWIDAEL